jgi:CRISPR/Cas system-associated exonuclease Cas4 (RecB family)
VNLPNIEQDIRDALAKDIRIYHPRSNYASALGHPCARRGVYARANWQDKKLHDVTTEMIFRGGKMIEQHIAKEYLEQAGYEILMNNVPIESESSRMLDKLQIGGRLDFMVRKKGDSFKFPVEVKSMVHHEWERLTCIEDFLQSKRHWVKSYPGQLALYMLGKDCEYGMFLLISKQTFEPKAIWVNLDYTFAETLLKRAEEINAHVAAGTYPERIQYDDGICGRCDFAHICLPDVMREGAAFLEDPMLIEMLEQRDALKDKVDGPKHELEDLDKSIKKLLEGVAKAVVGGKWMVIGKMVKRAGYAVEDTEYWTTSIKKIEESKKK